MSEFYYRTESISKEKILELFVSGDTEDKILESFFSQSHIILEGSRGSGKSFLMKVANTQMYQEFDDLRILPVYITFMQSSLLHSKYEHQFYYWMLAKILRETLKSLQKKGIIISKYANSLIGANSESQLEDMINQFEETYKKPNLDINNIENLPELGDIIDAIEDICEENNINRITYFFDEAAHVFRPEQQRQFFSLFRDFKSPFISCKASVYPGVTHYGESFEMTHDAFLKRVDRDILSKTYLDDMLSLVLKQGGEFWQNKINNNKELFNTLAFASGGNPRLLLKTLDLSSNFKLNTINDVIRQFYRNEIWSEHTQLGEKYKGHKAIIDWGRTFVEDHVLPATINKIQDRIDKKISEATLYFWVTKEAPEQIKEALRLLTYTGVIRKYDSGVKATKSKIGDRYEIKFGCILAQFTTPANISKLIIPNVQLEMFTEYGRNNSLFNTLKIDEVINFSETEFYNSFKVQLDKNVNTLDLTPWLLNKLREINIVTIGELLNVSEEDLMQLKLIGPFKSRLIKNAAIAEILETISG
ncbi:DNA-directed RNA polymerase subunit alpha C-terminal domain-containing protein [Chryseobacterium sp. C39-AII1]|uniref:ORC-CDC6 family AAA ATPase n=1 Tax=Chryseobacterium sp. C39-AII1 TaxID=3080332 RepID=UPI00320AC82E